MKNNKLLVSIIEWIIVLLFVIFMFVVLRKTLN
jgi:hypothetical protein